MLSSLFYKQCPKRRLDSPSPIAELANPRERQDNSSGENQKPDKPQRERPQDYGERLTRSTSSSISIRNDRARKGRQCRAGRHLEHPQCQSKTFGNGVRRPRSNLPSMLPGRHHRPERFRSKRYPLCIGDRASP